MNAQQLWETTMDPENRMLKQVNIDNAAEADYIFSMLMGEDVGPRREFIEENATPMSEELIIAPEPALAVIELNAGDVKKHGIKIGDTVKHHFFDEFNKKVYEDEGKQPPREEESNSVSSQEVQEDAQPQPADTEPASPSDEGSPVSLDGEMNKTEKVLSE